MTAKNRRRCRKPRAGPHDDDLRCPKCARPVQPQYDTTAKDPFFHCWDCDESFGLDLQPTIYMTNVPKEG